MRTKTKALVLALCAVLLVVTTVFVTMAYLTSEDSVQNTFTVGKVTISLDEADVDLYGVKDSESRVQKNEYKLIPGHTYVKDPTVTVEKGSEKSYVRMLVTITDFEDVKAVFGNDFLPQYFVEGWDRSVWISTNEIEVSEDGNTAVYEFWYEGTVDALDKDVELPALFTNIFVPDSVDGDDIAKLEEMEVNVVAHAIQADGFATAEEAWAAWDSSSN